MLVLGGYVLVMYCTPVSEYEFLAMVKSVASLIHIQGLALSLSLVLRFSLTFQYTNLLLSQMFFFSLIRHSHKFF